LAGTGGPAHPGTRRGRPRRRRNSFSLAAKQKLARLPKPKHLDERVIALEQQIDALIAGLEAIDPGGDEVKTQLAYKVTHLIEEQLNLIAQRVESLEMEDAIRLSEIVREQAIEDYKKATE
jgi:hypothetical protein